MNKKLFSVLFFLSGLCGLMYQILWTRLFSFVLGNTYLAISMIVASFMFGLFLGSWLIGRYMGKVQSELRWYALLEMLIGGYALLLLVSFGVSESIFRGLYALLGTIELLHLFGKFLLTLVFIVIPTSAMGATLPLAVQYYTRNKEWFGDNISLFYAINTIGGAFGVLIAGFFLVEQLGVNSSIFATAFINIGIGAIVLLTMRAEPAKELVAANDPSSKKVEGKSKKRKPPKQLAFESNSVYLLVAALAGFAALSYEIIWTRGLKFLVHNSTYSFSVILFIFLLGIASGSGIAKKVIKPGKNLHYVFGLLQTVLALYAIFTIYLLYNFSYSEFFQTNIIEIIYDYSYSWHWAILIYSLICAMMFLVPALIMGILFPVINELFFNKNQSRAGQTVSSIYAVNTVGGIIGSLTAGFFLLPVLGIKTSILIVSLINLLLGVVFVAKSKFKVQTTLLSATAAFLLVFILSFDGKYLFGRGEKDSDAVLFYQEGLMSTVKVFHRNNSYFMSIDGNTIASTQMTLFKKEKLIAHLPFFLKRDIENVLSVGLASGISVGSMALHDEVQKIHCVELIRPVFPAARYFVRYNFDIFNNRKVNLIYDDIYAYLKYHDEKYDLISSDGKLGTLYSGNNLMLSKDFYELSKQRLKKDGLFIQWVPIITPHNALKVILDTLKNSFEYVALFYFYPTDIFMLASESPILLDKSSMDNLFANTNVRRDLGIFKIKDSESVLSAYIGAYETEQNEKTKINSFDRPYLEFAYMRDWKKSKKWTGGYRAKNLQFLLANFEKTDFNNLYTSVRHIEKPMLNTIVTGSKLFFKGCINFFKTGHFQNSFREYREFKNNVKS